nr:hypothetical protein CFP56_20301 [Quercus suber]
MAKLNLQDLPQEILHKISVSLSATCRRSLCSLSVVSKTCRYGALLPLFESICLKSSTQNNVGVEAIVMYRSLESMGCLGHVRRLHIRAQPPEFFHHLLEHAFRDSYPENEPGDENLVGQFGRYATEMISTFSMRFIERFIRSLSGMTDLFYHLPHGFPPHLLDALPSKCRLHLMDFHIRSLDATTIDPCHWTVLSSKHLHSIFLRNDDGHDGFMHHENSVLTTIAGLAPNLKVASILGGISLPVQKYTGQIPVPRIAQPPHHPASKGSLEVLRICGRNPHERGRLETWRAHTDFSCLRVLMLYCDLQGNTVLWDLKDSMPLLEELSLRCTSRIWGSQGGLLRSANEFFASLRPLRRLELAGELSNLDLSSILKHHGQQLVKFHMTPCESSLGRKENSYEDFLYDLQRIQRFCPLLENVNVRVPCSAEGVLDANIIRTLASLAKVQTCLLLLECVKPSSETRNLECHDHPLFPSQHKLVSPLDIYPQIYRRAQPARRGCVLDETATRAIFHSIASAKAPGTPTIQNLHVRFTGPSGLEAWRAIVDPYSGSKGPSQTSPPLSCRHFRVKNPYLSEDRTHLPTGTRSFFC